MPAAIQFDDQAGFKWNETDGIIFDGRLPSKFYAINLPAFEIAPQDLFCLKLHYAWVFLHMTQERVYSDLVFLFTDHPPPNPSRKAVEMFRSLNIGIWDLFWIWCLWFGILTTLCWNKKLSIYKICFLEKNEGPGEAFMLLPALDQWVGSCHWCFRFSV